MGWTGNYSYGRLLSTYPGGVCLTVAVFAVSCLIAVFTAHSIPDFSDPQLGFECRGTVLSQRATAWENLLRATKRAGPLVTNPLEAIPSRTATKNQKAAVRRKNRKHKKKNGSRLERRHGATWGQAATHNNNLDGDQINIDQVPASASSNEKTRTGVETIATANLRAQDWQVLHPLEVLHGWDSSKAFSANHSHFQWGATVTRAPLHQIQPKQVWNRLQQLEEQQRDDEEEEQGVGGGQEEDEEEEKGKFSFCDQPHADYAHVIFASTANKSLWSLAAIQSMCRFDQVLRSSPVFPSLCQTKETSSTTTTNECCSSWSIGHYIALLTNRTSCFDLMESDVSSAMGVLETCAKHYQGLQLSANCDSIIQEGSSGVGQGDDCGDVPEVCVRHNAVYHIFHYLADARFLVDGNRKLRLAALFLPTARSTALLPYFHSLDSRHLADNWTQLVAMEFGLKEALFNEYVMNDIVLLMVGATVVCSLMWWYTSSLFLTLMANVSVVLSLAVAYFVYVFVFELDFFPFMNLLAAVIVVGIGADDVFVYIQVWRCTKLDVEGSTPAKLVTKTLTHAGLSMFVTSCTTAAAFFSSFLCPVTAIRCFSLFAGLSVTIHLLFMLSWLPAAVLLSERYCSTSSTSSSSTSSTSSAASTFCRMKNWLDSASDVARIVFEKILPCVVIKLRYVWVVLFGGAAVAAAFVVFYHPKLKLPDTKEFQLFYANHPFERYDLEFKQEFWFEKSQHTEYLAKLPMRFVWGVSPEDNGNYLEPGVKGSLVLDPTFHMASPESQMWLLRFCKNLREQPFYLPTLGPLLPNCFIETFKSWMDRRCQDSVDGIDRTPCCEVSEFPFSEDVFEQCIVLSVRDLFETPSQFFLPGLAGPRFSIATDTIEAVVVEYDSNVSYSLSYQEMHHFYHQVEGWMQKQLETAPAGMRNGWFTSDLAFYDVQNSLSASTISAIALTMVIAFIVLVCATCNLWLSFISVVCLSCVVLVSVGALVLLDWKLNILESVSVSLAVGLSVDFTLHYAIGYRLSGEKDRESAVIHSLTRMSSPIAMAAVTTFTAGASVLPSSVVAYNQIGTFVVVVMATSWLYSTFFLPSLLRLCGPQDGCTQINVAIPHCCCRSSASVRVDKTIYSYGLSDSTLSTSSTTAPAASNIHNVNLALVNGEAHELEPLTTSSSRLATAKYRPSSDGVRQIHFPPTALLAPDGQRSTVEMVHIETISSDVFVD